MKIASFTLAGPGTADIIGDALRSVAAIVGITIVIDTTDEGRHENTKIEGRYAGIFLDSKAIVRWPWQSDFAAARNAGLDAVAAFHGMPNWALMIDTDERAFCADPAALCAWLDALPDAVQVVLVRHHDGSHTRERFFRLPARYKFQGRTHEMYPCPATEQVIAPAELIVWTELPKTREQLRAKFTRDVAMLREDIAANHKNGAALYYLGVSLQSLALYAREDAAPKTFVPGCGRCEQLGSVCEFHGATEDDHVARSLFTEAIEAYRRHREIDTSGEPAWHEGTAFSCYRAAECYLALGQPDRAIDCAAAGMVLDAGIAELPWIAAVASLQVGRLEQARCWAEMAKAHAMGSEAERRRVGFRLPRGLTTGPDDVLDAVRAQFAPDAPCSWVGIRDANNS